jgi:hypothetical protein
MMSDLIDLIYKLMIVKSVVALPMKECAFPTMNGRMNE